MKPDTGQQQPEDERTRPAYEPPRIVGYDEEALTHLIGPAVACARWDAGSGDGFEDDEGVGEAW